MRGASQRKEERLAESYRLRAEELRTLAELDGQPHTREMLLRVASDYEKMALSVASIAQSKQLLSKSDRN